MCPTETYVSFVETESTASYGALKLREPVVPVLHSQSGNDGDIRDAVVFIEPHRICAFFDTCQHPDRSDKSLKRSAFHNPWHGWREIHYFHRPSRWYFDWPNYYCYRYCAHEPMRHDAGGSNVAVAACANPLPLRDIYLRQRRIYRITCTVHKICRSDNVQRGCTSRLHTFIP